MGSVSLAGAVSQQTAVGPRGLREVALPWVAGAHYIPGAQAVPGSQQQRPQQREK